MGLNTAIEWTDHTWNPWRGCHKVSAGCLNCYMFRGQRRFGNDPEQVVRASKGTFRAPEGWNDVQKRHKVFVCSWSDFFIAEADAWRFDAWEVIRHTPYLTYQILTKRPENILDRLPEDWGSGWPNVWLGVTAENQAMADERIPALLKVPAKLRFVSCEPLLGQVYLRPNDDFSDRGYGRRWLGGPSGNAAKSPGIDWVIVGGESGPGRRYMDSSWVMSLLEQCKSANVPFFFKQWGGGKKIEGAWGGRRLGENHKIYSEFPEVSNVR